MINPLLSLLLIGGLPVLVGLILMPFIKVRPGFKARIVAGTSRVQIPLLFLIIGSIPPDSQLSIPWFSLSNAASQVGIELAVAPPWSNLVMAVFVVAIAAAVHGFSLIYIRKGEQPFRFQMYIGAFSFMMLNLILAGNLLQLFMAWELVGLMSWLLIGYDWRHQKNNKAALLAFLTNRTADLGLMLALAICWVQFGSWDISYLANQDLTEWHRSGMGLVLGLALLVGAMGKSAQVPFQHWLPAAMAGPTPASALIHAATMVTAGLFVLMRVNFLLGDSIHLIMLVVGSITAMIAGYWALTNHDLKAILAYSTISQLGFMMMGLGSGHQHTTMFYLMTHGIAKAGLFLAAGSIMLQVRRHLLDIRHTHPDLASDHLAGQDLRLVGGLGAALPMTMLAIIGCAASLMGLPLFVGFFSKDLLLEGLLHPTVNLYWGPYFAAIGLLVATLTSAYLTRLIALLLLPALLSLDKRWEAKSYLLWGIPTGLAFGGLFIVHTLNPFGHELYWLTLPHTDLPTLIPVPLMAIVASGIGILIGLLLARRDRYAYWQITKEANAQGFTKLPAPAPNLNTIWTTQISTFGHRFSTQLAPFVAQGERLDGLINNGTKLIVVLAHVLKFVERYIIDGIVTLSQIIALKSGDSVSQIGGRRVQGYITATLLILVGIAAWWIW